MNTTNTQNNYLYVAEIFQSIDGEVNYFHQGRQTVFLRLSGCNFLYECKPCKYCDTQKYLDINKGEKLHFNEIFKKLSKYKCRNLTITGGEPLFQKEALVNFLNRKEMLYWSISIETNGSIKIPYWERRAYPNISWVIDYKLTSPQIDSMRRYNWLAVRDKDWFKIVVPDSTYIDKALKAYNKIREHWEHIRIAFSPGWYGSLVGYRIKSKIILDALKANNINDVVLNLQLHKLLNLK